MHSCDLSASLTCRLFHRFGLPFGACRLRKEFSDRTALTTPHPPMSSDGSGIEILNPHIQMPHGAFRKKHEELATHLLSWLARFRDQHRSFGGKPVYNGRVLKSIIIELVHGFQEWFDCVTCCLLSLVAFPVRLSCPTVARVAARAFVRFFRPFRYNYATGMSCRSIIFSSSCRPVMFAFVV